MAWIYLVIASFYFLARALKTLPMNLAYPIWTGVGAVGSILVGVWLYKEKLSLSTWCYRQL